jgi:hypothetical protein
MSCHHFVCSGCFLYIYCKEKKFTVNLVLFYMIVCNNLVLFYMSLVCNRECHKKLKQHTLLVQSIYMGNLFLIVIGCKQFTLGKSCNRVLVILIFIMEFESRMLT